MALLSTPAILLRAHPYSESSRILRFYTRDAGLVAVVARGVRSAGGKGAGGLESFAGGTLMAYVRPSRELHTFKEFAASRARRSLGESALRMGGAALVAELVLRHGGEEPNPHLFAALEGALDRIAGAGEAEVLATLLSESWRIVCALGYAPVLDACTRCGRPLGPEEMGRFDFAAGGVCCQSCGGERGPRVGPGARAQLHALVAGEPLPGPLARGRAHLQLLGDFVTYHVSGARPLTSFAFLAAMIGEDDA